MYIIEYTKIHILFSEVVEVLTGGYSRLTRCASERTSSLLVAIPKKDSETFYFDIPIGDSHFRDSASEIAFYSRDTSFIYKFCQGSTRSPPHCFEFCVHYHKSLSLGDIFLRHMKNTIRRIGIYVYA